MLAVVIPAHNEETMIAQCLHSVIGSSHHPALNAESVKIFVVADDCIDQTASIAAAMSIHVLHVEHHNVGAARATGAAAALLAGARWLAFTDADTTVPRDWLALQLACNAEVVCGVITIDDWSMHDQAVRDDFITTYRNASGHRHIHGANLGIAASAYKRVGGFQSCTSNEDVGLVEALISADATIAWSADVRVTTSARLDSRAPKGFGEALLEVSRRIAGAISRRPTTIEDAIK